ncbi:Conserved_hypothetical protein [Hexamita inflata]|uniref:Uncharacterized protein n=1 Tax=Hexamita inflata TaxID=28002 RepID=A0AA86N8K7_9EUKA|nr:Conserved hypothetical protein [Hexamita inflata]CAI9970422.1 Conserved hypothetical protein [Hexamita inflata]
MQGIRSFLYNPSTSHAPDTSTSLQSEILSLQQKLDQQTARLYQADENYLAMQKQSKQTVSDLKAATFELNEAKKKIREQAYELETTNEELTDFKQKVQSLEVLKFDYAEQVDDLNVKLLECQDKLREYELNFDIKFQDERAQMNDHIQALEQHFQEQQAIMQQNFEKQIQQKQAEIDQLQGQAVSMQEENRELASQLSEQLQKEQEQTNLLNQAYQLYKSRKQPAQIPTEFINTIQQTLRQMEEELNDQDMELMRVQKEQKRIDSQLQVFAANLETREPTGAKTFAYLKEQLTQKTVENMQLTQKVQMATKGYSFVGAEVQKSGLGIGDLLSRIK